MKSSGFKPKWIIIHHSFSTDDSQTRNWDSISRYHVEELGWRDVGYQFGIELVAGQLKIMQGRELGDIGAHTLGFNDKSVGICLVGNYDNDEPDKARMFAMASLCREMQREFKIPRDQILGHRETYRKRGVSVVKSCPGRMFDMDKLRSMCIDPEAKEA